jgi:hypothetical protein
MEHERATYPYPFGEVLLMDWGWDGQCFCRSVGDAGLSVRHFMEGMVVPSDAKQVSGHEFTRVVPDPLNLGFI